MLQITLSRGRVGTSMDLNSAGKSHFCLSHQSLIIHNPAEITVHARITAAQSATSLAGCTTAALGLQLAPAVTMGLGMGGSTDTQASGLC